MKKFFKDPWTIGIGTSVLGVLALRLIDWLTGDATILSIPFNWVTGIIGKVVALVSNSYIVEFYGLVIIFSIGFLFGLIIASIKRRKNDELLSGSVPLGQEVESKPTTKSAVIKKVLSYVRETFDGVQYRWTYETDFQGKYVIENIRAHCTNCDCALIGEQCPNCNATYYNKVKDDMELRALIMHRLEKRME